MTRSSGATRTAGDGSKRVVFGHRLFNGSVVGLYGVIVVYYYDANRISWVLSIRYAEESAVGFLYTDDLTRVIWQALVGKRRRYSSYTLYWATVRSAVVVFSCLSGCWALAMEVIAVVVFI